MKKIWGTFALLAVLVSTLFSIELNAAGTNTASNCTGAGGQSQLGQYCNSAQSSQQGSDADSALWKVWGGVSVVCIHACLSGGGGVAGTTACNVDSAAGSATQAVVTKNYASGLMSVGQGQATSYASSKMSGNKSSSNNSSTEENSDGTSGDGSSTTTDTSQDAQKAKKAKMSACTGAATAISKSITNYRSMQSAAQAANTTKKAATSLNSNAAETTGGKTTAASLASSRGAAKGSGKDGVAAATAGGTTASICASARQTSGTVETLQCAAASDPTLPAMVTSGQLPAAFTKASGTAFSNFGNDPNQSAADAITQAASGSLSTGDGLKLAAVLKGMEGDIIASEGAMYASGGSAANIGKSDELVNPAELQEQMKDLVAKMQGDQAAAQPDSGISAVIYANQNRAPASIAQDKSLSIFDRVTYRYYFVVKQLRVENFQ